MQIIGEKVILRPITMEDTDLVVSWRNQPAVQNNFIFRQKMTPQMHQAWMETKVAQGSVVQHIIIAKETSQPIGSVYFRDIDYSHESAEFGIFIGVDTGRGKGYGQETVRLFIKYGFEVLTLHRISLRVLAHNAQAIHIYQNAGFQQEGYFRDMVKIDGQFHDVIFMAALADDFKGMGCE